VQRKCWTGGDGYLHAFRLPFDADSVEGCIAGNDDYQGLGGSQITNIQAQPGEVIVIVASTYDAQLRIDSYTMTFETFLTPRRQ
jgi:hypothetical protein